MKWKRFEISYCLDDNDEIVEFHLKKKDEVKKEEKKVIIEDNNKEKPSTLTKKFVKDIEKGKQQSSNKELKKMNNKKYKEKLCKVCGEIFTPHSGRQCTCDTCKTNSKKSNKAKDDEGDCASIEKENIEESKNQPLSLERICKCGKKFTASVPGQKFCSLECRKKYYEEIKEVKLKSKIFINECKVCGNKFETHYKNKQYCSDKCKEESHLKTNKCKLCGEEFKSPYTRTICDICHENNKKEKENKKNKKCTIKPKEEKSIEELEDILAKNFCPVCHNKKETFKTTCGRYTCIREWNKSSETDRQEMLNSLQKLVDEINADPRKKRFWTEKIKGVGNGEPSQILPY